ncbi:MAG: anacyclamide/piricyclamide family prenylated cyclic peptide [Nostocales cyanobacterium ELA583]|jgi:prenylated cyclic peptide (anacyclamide/piricyclamide family)
MTKKNIRPQQVAPVERETISTAKDKSGQVTPLKDGWCEMIRNDRCVQWNPFAGDDAE